VHSARWDATERPTLREIDMLVGHTYLVTFHEGATRSISQAHELLPRRPELLGRGPAYLLHFLLDVMVDGWLPITDRLAERVDALEERIVHSMGRRTSIEILRLKRGMSALRRIVGPQRDTVLALTRDEFRAIPAGVRPYLRDVYDRLARMTDLLDSFRDEVAGLLDLHMTQVSNRLNQVMKMLTVISTIVLPLTLITGYYGMNVKIAAFEWRYGELFVLGVLVATGLGTWWMLRRFDWL
jgi:magnesium transporter